MTRRAWLTLAVTAVALVVVLGGGFAWPGWFTPDRTAATAATPANAADPGPAALTEAYVAAANAKDVTRLRTLLCPALRAQFDDGAAAAGGYQALLTGATVSARVLTPPTVTGTTARAGVRQAFTGAGLHLDQPVTVTMTRGAEGWRICGLAVRATRVATR